MTEQNLTAMEEQLARLQEAIATRRATEGTITPEAPPQRAEVHQALGEQIKQEVPAFTPKPPPIQEASNIPAELVQPVQELVTVAFTRGPSEAISQAMKSGNSALVDALHDVMADQLHAQLLERHKITPAP